jgi:hypothetical protein
LFLIEIFVEIDPLVAAIVAPPQALSRGLPFSRCSPGLPLKHQRQTIQRTTMTTVFIEAHPKGRPEGSPITDYVIEDHADHPLASFKTQHEAIDWARKNGHSPHVARVRHLNDKKKPDHWRAV